MVLSTLTVRNTLDDGPGSLRAVIAAARSGDTIAFAPKLKGQTIVLSSGEVVITKSLFLDGPGANNLIINAEDASRIFDIRGGVTVTIAGLTLANGFVQSDQGGGGILNEDSTLSLAGDVLYHNTALGLGGPSAYVQGGAINNLAGTRLAVLDSLFVDNHVLGGPDGEGVGGGALGTLSTASITGSTFAGNLARAGDGGVAPANAPFTGDAMGGAIVNMMGTTTVDRSIFLGNRNLAGSGGSGGSGVYFIDSAYGGALMDCGGTMAVNNSTIAYNLDQGGSNATGGPDLGFIGDANGGGFAGYGVITMTNSTFDQNEAVSGSHDTGSSGGIDAAAAYGGAICTDGGALFGFSDSFTASNLRLTNNRVLGGTGNKAGGNPAGVLVGTATGGGFVLFDGGKTTATIIDSIIVNNQAIGGAGQDGGDGADGQGGGLATHLGGILLVSNCQVDRNQAVGGAGAAGGNGFGGGVFGADGATVIVTASTITANQAQGGAGRHGGSPGQGVGGGIYDLGTLTFDAATIIVHNHASTSHDNLFV